MNAPLPTLEHALALAAAGWAIIPLEGKIPLTAHGVKDATRDPAVIHSWWRQPHNIGARVPDELIVLDFDPRNGGNIAVLEDALSARLPATLTVHSGRHDGGQHRYYMRPPGNLSASRLPNGIDVKKNTGYCVVPPSVHPATNAPYYWESRAPVPMPVALQALLRPPAPKPFQTNPGTTVNSAARVDALVRAMAGAPEGRRNDMLFWAASRALENGLGENAVERIAEAARSSGLTDREIDAVCASAHRARGGTS